MPIVVNTKTYVADVPSSKDSIPYVGPSQSLSVQDNFHLYRTAPKPTADFSGVARARVKLARTLTLTGAKTTSGLATLDVMVNIPVGAASADVDSMLSDLSVGLGQSWAQDLAKKLDLTV